MMLFVRISCSLPLLCLATLPGCGRELESDSAPASLNAPLEKASATLTSPAEPPSAVTFRTVVYSEHDAEISARMAGVVRAIHAEIGDAVANGSVLAVLEDERETAAWQSAEASLELARVTHARARALREREMNTQADLDESRYRERVAEAALRNAAVLLSYTRVRAPFAGTVSQRLVRIGQTVREGDPLFRVTALVPLRAAIRLPELQARNLARGHTVQLHTLDGTAVAARIVRIAPTVDAASGTVEILLDIATPGSLRPGATVTAEIDPEP